MSDDVLEEMQGAFVDSLKRTNKSIRGDRATAIAEDAEMAYGRAVQDLEMEIKRKRREQINMLDLSPDNAQSLIVASNFDAVQYVERDTKLAWELRNLEIKLELAQKRYEHLFGGDQ